MNRLMEWTFAVDRFLEAGDAKEVSRLALDTVAPVLKQSRGRDTGAAATRDIAKALAALTKNLYTCRGPEIPKASEHLKRQLSKAKDVEEIKPLVPLFEHIQKRVAPFRGDAVHDGIQAAKWCLGHNLIQQGFTILQETLITHFVTMNGHDPGSLTHRNIAASAVGLAKDGTPENEWRGDAGKHMVLTRQYISMVNTMEALSDIFRGLTPYRNDLAHAGYRDGRKKPGEFEKKLGEAIPRVEALIDRNAC